MSVPSTSTSASEPGGIMVTVPPGIAEIDFLLCGCIEQDKVWRCFLQHLERLEQPMESRPEIEMTAEWYIVECLLDHFNLSEHGTSIRYAWMDAKGRAALQFLLQYGPGWKDREDINFITADTVWLNPH